MKLTKTGAHSASQVVRGNFNFRGAPTVAFFIALMSAWISWSLVVISANCLAYIINYKLR